MSATGKPEMNDRNNYSPQTAADYLQAALPESPAYWKNFLVNNRRLDRKPAYRIPVEKRGGEVIYRQGDLNKFVEWEKSRRLGRVKLTGRAAELMQAFGINQPGGGVYGRALDCTVSAQCTDTDRFIQLVINDPLMVFRISVDQAQRLSAELNQAVQTLNNALL